MNVANLCLASVSLENAIAVSVLTIITYVGGTVVNSCYNYVENIWYQFETPNLIYLFLIRGGICPLEIKINIFLELYVGFTSNFV